MEESTKVDKEVIEKDKDKDTLVLDENNRVIDFDTILNENRDDAIVNNINNLLNCGSNYVSKEVIKERFAEKTGTMVTEEIAMDVLQEVFDEFVNLINTNDEFVMVSGKDGKIDRAGTEKKMRENSEYRINKNDDEEKIRRIFESKDTKDDSKYKSEEHIQAKRREVSRVFEREKPSEWYINLKKNIQVNEKTVGSKLLKEYNDSIEYLKYYTQEEIDLIEFDRQLENSKGTPEYSVILNRRNEFLKGKEELEQNFIDPETGRIRKEDFEATSHVLKMAVIRVISSANQIGIENLTYNHKINAVKDIICGLNIPEIRDEVANMLAQMIPDYDPSKDNVKENRIALEKFLGFDMLQVEGFEELLKASSNQILKNFDVIKAISEGKITDEQAQNWYKENAEELNIGKFVRENNETFEEKYFRSSKIEFSEKDKNDFQFLYQHTTVKTWISSKSVALNYRFMHLLNTKQKLEENGNLDKEFINKRLEEVNKELEDFVKNNPNLNYDKIVDESGNLRSVYKGAMERYEEYRIKSELTTKFREDQENVNSFEDYNKLSDHDKKVYLRNTIIAINYENQKKVSKKLKPTNDVISKFGKRRLEILNSTGIEFIKFDNKNNSEINFDVILDEYNKLSSHNFENYNELLDFCELNKSQYVVSKMKKLETLSDKEFGAVVINGRHVEDVISDIERIKTVNYRKLEVYDDLSNKIIGKIDAQKIDELQLPSELKDRITILDKQINSEDKELMEFQRLQNEIESTYGNDQKDAIKKRDELIRKNPDKRKQFLEFVKNPVESNMKLEVYNNAIVEKNALLTIGTINSLSEENLEYLIENPELKRKVMLTLIASLDGILEDYQPELISTIQKICPNSKLIDEETGKMISDFEKLSPMLGNELGIEDCDIFTVSRIMYTAKTIMLQNENSKKIDNVDEKDMNKALSIESLSKLSDMFSSTVDISELAQNRQERYFKNSKYKYTENDDKEFNDLYCKTLSGSWIEEKHTAEKYRYIMLLSQDEERKNNPLITEKGHIQFNKNLKDFEEKHPSLKREDFIENGILKDDVKKEFLQYVNMKYVGDLMSDYVIDEDKVESPEDYQNLSEKEKRVYIYKSVLGLLDNNKENPIISKLATRRLEIISTPEKNFMKDEENFEVDKEAVFNEFAKLYNLKEKKDIEVNCFDDFENLYKNSKLVHARSRLKRYDQYTHEDEFQKLISTNDIDRAKEIQKNKANNALRRSLGEIEDRILNSNIEKVSSEDNRNIKFEKSDNLTEKSQRTQNENYETLETEKTEYGNESSMGIKLEDIKIDNIPSKEISKDDEPQELVQDEETQNVEQPKLSFVDRIKSAISNFRKTIEENTDELALVETKGGFLDNIKNAMKNMFGKNENNMETEEAHKQEETQIPNTFDQRYKVDVDRSKAINNIATNKTSQESNRETENKDDVSYGE